MFSQLAKKIRSIETLGAMDYGWWLVLFRGRNRLTHVETLSGHCHDNRAHEHDHDRDHDNHHAVMIWGWRLVPQLGLGLLRWAGRKDQLCCVFPRDFSPLICNYFRNDDSLGQTLVFVALRLVEIWDGCFLFVFGRRDTTFTTFTLEMWLPLKAMRWCAIWADESGALHMPLAHASWCCRVRSDVCAQYIYNQPNARMKKVRIQWSFSLWLFLCFFMHHLVA